MLERWISKLEPIHIAEMREEQEAVYRFRYDIYYKEFGRLLGIYPLLRFCDPHAWLGIQRGVENCLNAGEPD